MEVTEMGLIRMVFSTTSPWHRMGKWLRDGIRPVLLIGGGLSLVSALVMVVVPSGVASASTGFQNLSSGTLGSTNENCQSLVVGAHTPKVIKSLLPGSQEYPGGILHYQVTLDPAPSSTYNIRDCLIVESPSGNVLSVLEEAQFNNVTPSGTYTFDYALPTSAPNLAPPNKLCNVVKTQGGTTNGGGQDRKSNFACFNIQSPPAPNLLLTKTADSTAVTAPAPIGFQIVATNNGTADATGFTLTDTLPTNPGLGTWVESVTSGSGFATCSISAGVLSCGPMTLAAGASFTVHLTNPLTSGATGTVNNTASETATNATSPPPATATVVVGTTPPTPAPNLLLTKTADSTAVAAPAGIGFQIVATNNGTGPATGFTLTDTLPTNAGLGTWAETVTSGVASCSISAGVLSCGPMPLAAGASFTVHLTNPTTSAATGTVNNTASEAASNATSPPPATATVVVSPPAAAPSLGITKTADTTRVIEPNGIGFTIDADNNGTADATSFSLTDTLPTNPGLGTWSVSAPTLTGNQTVAPTCSITTGVLTCTVATLVSDGGFIIDVTNPTTSLSTANTDVGFGTGVVSNTAVESATNATSPTPATATVTTTTAPPSQTAAAGATTATPAPVVAGATSVHTGEPWAGSRPLEAVVLGLGLTLLGVGERQRRRARRAAAHDESR
jgi:uncharacterized repeat protein (TIGR01451 family)